MSCLLGCLLWTGCATPEPPPPAEPAAPEPAAAPQPPGDDPDAPVDVPMVPIPAQPLRDDAVPVVLSGYGVRFTLNAPFQAAQMNKGVIVSYWDVTAPGAGASDVAGLHNVQLNPALPSDPEATFTESTRQTNRGDQVLLQLGADGTEIILPAGISALGGMGSVERGPMTEAWTVEAAGNTTAWPDQTMLHSADPASGAAFSFEQRPKKPWGPWPEPTPP